MSHTTIKWLIAGGTYALAWFLNWVLQHLGDSGLPAVYIGALTALIPVITHFLPTPGTMATGLTTGAQK